MGLFIVTGWDYLDPGWDYLDPGWDYLDPGLNYLDLSWDYLDPGWDYIDPGWDCLDPGWDYLPIYILCIYLSICLYINLSILQENSKASGVLYVRLVLTVNPRCPR